MKILVTGAAGYIGSNLTEYLLQKGHTVVGVDNFNDYYNPKLKEYNIKEFKDNANFHLYRTDILDSSTLESAFAQESGIEGIVHLAAWAGVTYSIEKPITYVKNNIEGTVNLLECAVKSKVPNFIFASTSSIYGDNQTPFVETMNTDHPLAPYPATKKACEVLLSTYSRNYGLNVAILRFFNPLGKRIRPDLALTKLVRSCEYGEEFPRYQDKTGRDYCYIEHMLEGIETLLKNPVKYEIFNFGNSSPVVLDELISTVEEVTGKKVIQKNMPSRKGEMNVTFANIDKTKKMIGYNPTTSIKEIVKIYYNWFIQQEDWYKKGEY